MLIEIWKPVVGYEDLYEVSNMGRVKSLYFGKEKILKGIKDKDGYFRVHLYKFKKQLLFGIHRLVLMAFIGKHEDIKKNQCNHKNGFKDDNRMCNLEWTTVRGNILHAFKIGLINHKGEKHPSSKLTEKNIIDIRKMIANGVKQTKIAKKI